MKRRRQDLAELLHRTGMRRSVARSLAFLATRNETTSVEVEKATGLRQPEVSLAMQELRQRKWVEKRDVKRPGKGRPVHAYRLAVPVEDIIESLAREERRKIERIRATIRELKRFSG